MYHLAFGFLPKIDLSDALSRHLACQFGWSIDLGPAKYIWDLLLQDLSSISQKATHHITETLWHPPVRASLSFWSQKFTLCCSGTSQAKVKIVQTALTSFEDDAFEEPKIECCIIGPIWAVFEIFEPMVKVECFTVLIFGGLFVSHMFQLVSQVVWYFYMPFPTGIVCQHKRRVHIPHLLFLWRRIFIGYAVRGKKSTFERRDRTERKQK